MSHLDYIVSEVKTKGKHEEPWYILDNAFFRGNDRSEKIKQWAESQGLTVAIDSCLRTYIFRLGSTQPN